jgi:glycosyltransferase involved in cell wall biosynthesis/O-antigen/teichoic acid export membrane protein
VTWDELRRALATIGRQSWLLFVALSVVNASNYLFHVAVSRVLGPGAYGALGSVLAVLTVLSVPLTAIQTTVATRVAGARKEDAAGHWQPLLLGILRPTLLVTLALTALSPFLSALLHLNSVVTSLWVAVSIVPAIMSAILRGALQGEMKFARLGLASIFPVLLRLALGLTAVNSGFGVTGAVAATVVSDLLGAGFALALLGYRKHSFLSSNRALIRRFLRDVAPVGIGLAAMWALIGVDLVLARHFLPGGEAGDYAAAGLLARAVLFVPGAVSLIALPHFSRHSGRGREAYRWLLASCIVVLVLGVLTAIFLFFAGDFVVSLTFGSEFQNAGDLLPALSLAMLGFGLINLLVYFHIAGGSRTYNLLWLVVVGEVAAIALAHQSGSQIAAVVLLLSWMVAALGFLMSRNLALSIPGAARLPADVLEYPHLTADDELEISVIVPTHNGGNQLVTTVESVIRTLYSLGKSYEILVVSDGSTDGSEAAVASRYDRVGVLHYARRQGKGIALTVGMTRARGRYVAFIDADGDLEASEFRGFCAVMDLYDPDLVIGSKRHPLSEVSYPLTRRLMSWIYHRVVRLLFGLNVRDTQTGMKLIRRDVLDVVLPRMVEKRFAFDLEFLVVARRLGYTRIFEAPIKLSYRFASTVSAKAAGRILLDTAAIYYRRYILRFYDLPRADPHAYDRITTQAKAEIVARERITG